jgi:heparan-alpha-glucosaminide N-acetyltransferase
MSPWAAEVAPTSKGIPAPRQPAQVRLTSVDAYRGLVMLLMMAEVLRFKAVSRALPDSSVWELLAHHQSHSAWVGCTLHDLIQPSFTFLVGVALPFSIASRRARGQSFLRMSLHAWWRALLLIMIGIFLKSLDAPRTVWSFHDTLSQIGMGYGFLFLLGFRPVRDQWIALALILIGYFAAFALYPLPAPGFDYERVAVSASWLKENGLSGFAAHWQKNSNLAWAFDTWWINLFPQEKSFVGEGGGYATLSFIPTLGTMVLGLIAGGVLRSKRAPVAQVRWLIVSGMISLGAGWLLGQLGICPVVKRLWTPSWVLFSGGWCLLFLAGFYAVLDLGQRKRWAFPLVVIGMNSIAAYCIAHLFGGFMMKNLKAHLGQSSFKFAGDAYEPFFLGFAVLLAYWLILYWMYRRKLFLRI